MNQPDDAPDVPEDEDAPEPDDTDTDAPAAPTPTPWRDKAEVLAVANEGEPTSTGRLISAAFEVFLDIRDVLGEIADHIPALRSSLHAIAENVSAVQDAIDAHQPEEPRR